MNIYEKQFKIIESLKAEKNRLTADGKYYYRTLADLEEELKPLLKKNKLTIIFNDGRFKYDGMEFIKAEAVLIDTSDLDQPTIKATSTSSFNTQTMSPIDQSHHNALCALFMLDNTFDDATEKYIKDLKDIGIPMEVK